MNRRTRLGLALAIAVAIPASARAQAPLILGNGSGSTAAIGAAGTAYLAWNGPEAAGRTPLVFCRLPSAATECDKRLDLPAQGTASGPAFVFTYVGGVAVFSSRLVNGIQGTYLYVATDGVGDNFDTGHLVSTFQFTSAVPGPGSSISGTSSYSGRFQNSDLPANPTTASADLFSNSFRDGAVGLLGASPLVVWSVGLTGGSLQTRRYDGSGSLNDAANWTPATDIGPGFFPRIAYDANGLFLLDGPAAGQLEVRKWTGTAFGPPAMVGEGITSAADIALDTAGQLHVAWQKGDAIAHAVSDDGVRWTTTTLAATDASRPTQDMDVAGGAGHTGVAIWTQNGTASGQEIRVARFGPAGTPTPSPTRKAPAGISGEGSAKRHGRKAKVKLAGQLVLPTSVGPDKGCVGTVTVVITRGKRVVARRAVALDDNCEFAFRTTVKSKRAERLGVRLIFGGNAVLTAKREKDRLPIT
jgi:hypothetical protein